MFFWGEGSPLCDGRGQEKVRFRELVVSTLCKCLVLHQFFFNRKQSKETWIYAILHTQDMTASCTSVNINPLPYEKRHMDYEPGSLHCISSGTMSTPASREQVEYDTCWVLGFEFRWTMTNALLAAWYGGTSNTGWSKRYSRERLS